MNCVLYYDYILQACLCLDPVRFEVSCSILEDIIRYS
jgi:hypothetical protein